VLDSSNQANSYQLILLAAEGVALCLICLAWVWILLRNVAARRFMLYSVLIVGAPVCSSQKILASLLYIHIPATD
jgi:hypothetical protein